MAEQHGYTSNGLVARVGLTMRVVTHQLRCCKRHHRSITFSDNELGVVLPRGLCAALPQLSTFIVTGAGLTGFIPDDLSRCSHLTVLDISNNSLSGSIPSSLGNLAPSLKQLHLFSNLLSGELPFSLSELWLVESLRIGDNLELSGQIPESFS